MGLCSLPISAKDSQTQAGLVQSLVGSLLVSRGSWCIQGLCVCVCVPSKSLLLPQSCGWSVIKSHRPSKSDSLRILSPLCQTPRLGSLLWIPELSQQCEHTVWITTNCGKFLNRWKHQTTLPASWETCMQVEKQLLEPEMEQQTGSKLQKEYVKAVYCHPAYLTYMRSTSREMPSLMKLKLKSRLLGEISITSDMQMTPPLWQKGKRNWRASWWKWNRKVKKLA